MPRAIVATAFVWSDYPGLRAGRLYAGKPDLTTHPIGETHTVDALDAVETSCGLSRASFPHDFPAGTALGRGALPCTTCRPGAAVDQQGL